MLDTLTMRSTPSEFPTFLKIILARQALTLSQNNHLEQSLTQMHQSITTFTKLINSKIFQIISQVLKIIPLIGPHLSSTTLIFHKLIKKLLTFTNSSLIITYHIINKLLFSKNNQYYDTKLAQLFGGEIVSKAMSITETPNYKILSTSNNIHKRIEKVSKIKKIPNLTIPTLIPQITTLITIILMFSSLIYLSYEIRIWRLYQFTQNFPTQIYHHIEDQITNL
jgi:hypothetical protein